MTNHITLETQYGAQNYSPLPVVLTKGKGIYVWDTDGKRYMDMMSAYSAVSFGHCHPRLIKKLNEQSSKLNVVSRSFYTDQLSPFLQKACELFRQDKALPMNSGAEAVETALKAARKWAYKVKGVEENKAEIIVVDNNFHGRTISIVAMSTEPQYRDGFAPFPPGFKSIPFGDPDALEKAVTKNTAAFLVEPIQGEGGIIIPPQGYLKRCAQICRKHNVLLIVDEIQVGLGRTGKLLACDHEDVKPDGLILGKALGGGILPVSLFLTRKEVMDVFTPGDHGSTFGGNALAAAIGLESLEVLIEEKLIERSAELGAYFLAELKKIKSPLITEVRGKGLFIGIEINPELAKARDLCLILLKQGLLSKETHHKVIRLAPPLIITQEQIDEALTLIRALFQNRK
jgi:ornithine--oxo-acid transaminase